MLASFKVRDIERLTYFQLLPRVLFNQIFILLPAMVAFQYRGAGFYRRAAFELPCILWPQCCFMGVGHDIVQYVFHRFVLHRPGLIRTLGHSVHHSTGASKGISACYMSPADFFLEIVLALSRSSVARWRWRRCGRSSSTVASLGAFGGLYEHSGYDFAVRFAKGQQFRFLAAAHCVARRRA